ncbi:hypothetical protein JCM8547_009083 [Rhodosporidiobolus lusitaniae]
MSLSLSASPVLSRTHDSWYGRYNPGSVTLQVPGLTTPLLFASDRDERRFYLGWSDAKAAIHFTGGFCQSDKETDKVEAKKTREKKVAREAGLDKPCKTVAVTDTAYSTYFAVLVWLQSRYISFARLFSSFRSSAESRQTVTTARSKAVFEQQKKSDPLLPPPVSPKSVYRLAHLLELDDLISLSLENLSSQLHSATAAYELFSNVSTFHPAVRDVILEHAVEKWKEMKGKKAREEMEERALAGELDAGAAGTAFLLAKRLAEREKKA